MIKKIFQLKIERVLTSFQYFTMNTDLYSINGTIPTSLQHHREMVFYYSEIDTPDLMHQCVKGKLCWL